MWKRDYLYLDEMYPLKYSKFGDSEIVIPNNSKKYLDRLFPGWSKEGRIYQSHVLRLELKDPIIARGPFKPAKDFDTTTKLVKASRDLLKNPYK